MEAVPTDPPAVDVVVARDTPESIVEDITAAGVVAAEELEGAGRVKW